MAQTYFIFYFITLCEAKVSNFRKAFASVPRVAMRKLTETYGVEIGFAQAFDDRANQRGFAFRNDGYIGGPYSSWRNSSTL